VPWTGAQGSSADPARASNRRGGGAGLCTFEHGHGHCSKHTSRTRAAGPSRRGGDRFESAASPSTVERASAPPSRSHRADGRGSLAIVLDEDLNDGGCLSEPGQQPAR